METIQVVLDTKLLQATDRAALRTKRNRSALIRDALREHLRSLEIRALEEPARILSKTSMGNPPGLAAVFSISGGTEEISAALARRFVPWRPLGIAYAVFC